MLVALAALEAGLLRPGETVFCPGHYDLPGRRFHCWRRGGHGHVSLIEGIAESCDVYFYEMAQRVGVDAISDMARRFGLGVEHDLPLSGVSEGLLPTRAWKQARYGDRWQLGDTLNAGIGQGFVLASPLQLAVMSARLATGQDVRPRLVKSIDGVEQPVEVAPLGLAAENLAVVQRGMHAVSNSVRGTAYRTRIETPELRMAGKTGTSQVRNITEEERRRGVFRNEDLPWNRRDHALYVAYAPFEAPRYAVSVVVEHGGGGSTAAAPIARDIMLFALRGGLPPLTDYPADQRARIGVMFEEMPLRAPARPRAERSRA